MAMFDYLLLLCEAKPFKTAFQSDGIDFRQKHPTTGANATPLFLNIVFPEDGAGTGDVTFALQHSDDGSSDWSDLFSVTVKGADCKSASPQMATLPITHKRFVRLSVTPGSGAALTAGKVTAAISDGYDLPPQQAKQGVEFFADATP